MDSGPMATGQMNKIDDVVLQFVRKGYQTVSRTPSNAFLVRPKRFNRLGFLWILVGFVGLPIYWALHLLLKRERSVTISADNDGYVTHIEKSVTPITKKAIVGGILLLLIAAAIIAGFVAAVKNAKDQTTGIHVCVQANYSSFSKTCTQDDHSITTGQVALASIVAGVPSDSSLRMNTLNITIAGTTSAGSAVHGDAVLSTGGSADASYIVGHLADVFSLSNVNATPGAYTFSVQGGTDTSHQLLGTYALTITN